jgi:hypothetical protein
MAKKRAKIDPAELFSRTEPPDTSDQARPAANQRKDEKVSYYIDPAVRERVRQLSAAWGCSQSQAAWYLLHHALAHLDQGQIPDPPLTPSSSPAYRHNIDFDKVD